jgi:hypothetical protein
LRLELVPEEIENYFQNQMRYTPIVVAVLAVPSAARADRKSFTHTYEYATTPEGQTEIELWHTELRDSWKASSAERFEGKIEVEYGLTDHWDIAMYTIFQQVASSDPSVASALSLDAVHLESRYKIAQRGELPVDTELYLELAKDFGASVYEIESKLILARDFDRVTAALNVIDEATIGHDVPGGENEIGYAFGLTYEVTPRVRIGAETWGMHGSAGTRISAGPALSFAASSKFWLAMTAGFGIQTQPEADLDQDLSAFSGRIVMGFDL